MCVRGGASPGGLVSTTTSHTRAYAALRERVQQKLGEQFSAKQFHLEFMKQGTIPAAYFADELLQSLQK